MNEFQRANHIAALLRATAPERRIKGIGRRTQEVLAFMRSYFSDNDQLPPATVIRDHFGWSSVNSVPHHTNALVAAGLIEHNANGKYRFTRREHA